MADRFDVEEVAVLQSILARLQMSLGLNDRQCYLVARPQDVPSLPIGGDYFATVATGDGTFPDGEQCPPNCMEETEVTVSIYTRIKTDSTGHDGYLLIDDARGLISIKKKVLKALVGQDLADADGAKFLRQFMHARRATAPELVAVGKSDIPCGRLQITFGVSFDWDLT